MLHKQTFPDGIYALYNISGIYVLYHLAVYIVSNTSSITNKTCILSEILMEKMLVVHILKLKWKKKKKKKGKKEYVLCSTDESST